MKFETWLRSQKKRNDMVGDLALDYIRALACDQRAPFSSKLNDVNSFEIDETMKKWGASDKAYDALELAKDEWKNLK